MRKTFAVLALVCLSACAKNQFETTDVETSLDNVDQGKTQITDRAECEVQARDFDLQARVVTLEMTDQYNVNVGFDLMAGIFKPLALKFEAATGTARMNVTATSPFFASTPIANEFGEATMNRSRFQFTFDLWKLKTDLGWLHQTPLFELSHDMIADGLANAAKSLAENPWNARVLALPKVGADELPVAILSAGRLAGLKVGDEFEIYNVIHEWEGGPEQACRGKYLMMRKSPSRAVAIATVTEVSSFASSVQLKGLDEKNPVVIGSIAQVADGMEKTDLKWSVGVRGVSSESLRGVDGSSVDLTPWLSRQFKEELPANGFVERP